MKIKIDEQTLLKIFVTRKNSPTSIMVVEKFYVAKIFGMEAAFKWNNKCVQVENTQQSWLRITVR